ncbi:MAG: glycosyltransferase [Chloroflexi bacterium]|nr:glycosyltransferase [Chloroflexota bacterium]
MPLVSVIIPTFNRANLVERAVRSVLAQTVQDFEILVVDDASKDDTERVVRAIRDPRVTYTRHDRNRGPGAARNTGIAKARGEFLAFLDSDDEWLPSKLQRQLDAFAKGSRRLGAVQCAVFILTRDAGVAAEASENRADGLVLRPPAFRRDAFDSVLETLGMPSTGSVVMVHRNVIDAGIRFDESLPAYEDYEFFLQISRRFQVETLDDPLSIKHDEYEGPHVWSRPNIIAGARGVIEKYRVELHERPRANSKRRLAFALTLSRAGDAVAARRQVLAVLKRQPWRPGNWLAVGLILAGARTYAFAYPKIAADRKLRRLSGRVWGLVQGTRRQAPVAGATPRQAR